MRMTASWFRSGRAYRIQGCGAMFAPVGRLPPRIKGDLDAGTLSDPDLVELGAVLASVKTAARRCAMAFGQS